MCGIELRVGVKRIFFLEHIHDDLVRAHAVPHWVLVITIIITLFIEALIVIQIQFVEV